MTTTKEMGMVETDNVPKRPLPTCSKPFFRKKRLFIFLPRRRRVGLGLRRSGANQPKSIPPTSNTNQKPTDTGQKMKSPIDLGCEEAAARGTTAMPALAKRLSSKILCVFACHVPRGALVVNDLGANSLCLPTNSATLFENE
jgi:hypothetical protein